MTLSKPSGSGESVLVAEQTATRAKFGTAPVFLTAISTILGAIMFLRFGYAVGHTGLAGAMLIANFLVYLLPHEVD